MTTGETDWTARLGSPAARASIIGLPLAATEVWIG